MKDEKITMIDDADAASFKNVNAWVSKKGFIFPNERAARYDGCTHRPCEKCGAPTEKVWLVCIDCRNKDKKEKYKLMPFKEWDGKTPLCIFNDDTFFFEEYDIEFYLKEHGGKPEDLELVLCEPCKLPLIGDDFFEDCLPEDYDLPGDLEDAIDVFNNTVKNCKPFSWQQGKYRTLVNHI